MATLLPTRRHPNFLQTFCGSHGVALRSMRLIGRHMGNFQPHSCSTHLRGLLGAAQFPHAVINTKPLSTTLGGHHYFFVQACFPVLLVLLLSSTIFLRPI